MIEATKRMTFDAGHRLVGHQGKCKGLHGHTYTVEVTIASETLNNLGMVLDFSDLKELMKEHIDERFDHKFIFNTEDPVLAVVKNINFEGSDSICPVNFNPTAENLAVEIFKTIEGDLPKERGVILKCVKLWETPSSFVEVTDESLKAKALIVDDNKESTITVEERADSRTDDMGREIV